MDAETYSNVAQGTARQPLGGKEIRFPYNGLSSVIVSSRLGVSYTPASVNVMFRSPHNWGRCGGTRPGLKAFTGTPQQLSNQHEVFAVSASKGSIPSPINASAKYRDRVVVAGGTMWYASRLGVLDDFDYGCDIADVTRAVAGNIALAGRGGETVTALAAIADSMLYVATGRSLWRVTGEITQAMSQVSDHIGIVGRHAWCWDGVRFWFWSDKGLYALIAGEPPVNMTPHLEDEVRGWSDAVLVFDSERNGIHVIGTDGAGAATDWFYDIDNKALWRMQYPAAKRPLAGGLAMLGGMNRVVFLCADGFWRYWDEEQADDDGTDIISALAMGPITHTTGNTENAFLAELDFEMDESVTSPSGVSVSGIVGRTTNEAIDAAKVFVGRVAGAPGPLDTARFTYVVVPGWQHVVRPRIRCNSFVAVLWSAVGRWAVSKITAVHRGCGRIRR